MRITQNYLKNWLSDEFKRLEIELEVRAIYKTRFRDSEYEGGAAFFILQAFALNSDFPCNIYIFYSLCYLQQELNSGYELFLQLKGGKYLQDSEINIRKKYVQSKKEKQA